MSLMTLLILLLVVGLVFWLINQIPMDPVFRKAAIIIVVVFIILVLLRMSGVLSDIRI